MAAMPEEIQAREPRYKVLSDAEGELIACANTPNVRLRVQRGVTVTKHGLKRFPRQSIFLDGAFSGAPFLDNARRQYSLDHHAGCVRSFTLASCEQAATMVFHGIPLHEGRWLLVVNGIDLDSILAAWILMNQPELARDESKLLVEIMPFVRLEGAIDAHGLEAGAISGLPKALREAEGAKIKEILPATRLPPSLSEAEMLQGTVRILDALDKLLLPEACLVELGRYVEVGRVALSHGKMAVACRSDSGVYEAEAFYKARFGSAIGLLLLDRGAFQYSIRLASGFLDRDIDELYKRLNKIDPAVSASRDSENRWGGSSDIGGSPRLSGSQLGPGRILAVVEEVYGERPSFLARLFKRK
jgi:hypothetical protein